MSKTDHFTFFDVSSSRAVMSSAGAVWSSRSVTFFPTPAFCYFELNRRDWWVWSVWKIFFSWQTATQAYFRSYFTPRIGFYHQDVSTVHHSPKQYGKLYMHATSPPSFNEKKLSSSRRHTLWRPAQDTSIFSFLVQSHSWWCGVSGNKMRRGLVSISCPFLIINFLCARFQWAFGCVTA